MLGEGSDVPLDEGDVWGRCGWRSGLVRLHRAEVDTVDAGVWECGAEDTGEDTGAAANVEDVGCGCRGDGCVEDFAVHHV